MRRFNRALALLGAMGILVIVLGAVVAIALQTDPRETRALSHPGRIVGVTFGPEPLITGNNVQKAVLRVSPSLEKRIGGSCSPPPSAITQRLILWQNTGGEGDYIDGNPGGQVTITGDDGVPFRSRAGAPSLLLAAGHLLLPLEFKTYPRRSKVLRIRLEGSPAEPEWVVGNPIRDRRPAWTPGRATQGFDNVVVNLSNARTAGEGYIDFGLQIREDGKPAGAGWQVERVTVSDPTGNTEEDHSPFSGPGPSGLLVRAAAQLPIGEPAYRIRVELARLNSFPPEDVWDFGEVQMPSPGKVTPAKRRGVLHGLPLTLFEIEGAGAAATCGASAPRAASIKVSGDYSQFCSRAILGSEENERPFSFRKGLYCWAASGVRPGGRYRLQFALTPKRIVEFLAPIATTRQVGRPFSR